jgi:hypothetical protein
MITEIIATVLFWVGATSVASALAFIPKDMRLFEVVITLGNILILLTSPLMLQWEFTIFLMTFLIWSAQIKMGRDAKTYGGARNGYK